jgi:hypothetical protein
MMFTFTATGVPDVTIPQDIPITRAAVNVTEPLTGNIPDTNATASDNFTISSVSWLPNNTAPYRANTRYSVQITLTAADGYTFSGINNANVTINGNRATVRSNDGTSLSLMYTFPPTETLLDFRITNVAVNITEPVTGETFDFTATGSGNFIISNVSWTPNNNYFRPNMRYSAQVTLTANEGYTFKDLTSVTINGQRATIRSNNEETLTLMFTFPPTGPEIIDNEVIFITAAAINVTEPVTGKVPDMEATGTGNFTIGSVTWTPNNNPFRANTRYSAQVTLL